MVLPGYLCGFQEGLEVKLQLKESEHRASLMQLRAELQAAWETEVVLLYVKLTEF